jgi:hypothetical protein
VGAQSDPVPFAEPACPAGLSEPTIDAMLEELGDDSRQLNRRYVAEELRSTRLGGTVAAWCALDGVMREIHRRNQERREA